MAEPLFCSWYAWLYLISPASAAMYVANQHLKLMRSFVASPRAHNIARQDPAMIGGPFISYDVDRVDEIAALIEKTQREQAPLLALAEAIKTLERTLASEANGFSLQPLYEKVPDLLKGYVELVYDLNNHASIRFIEGLLYKSPFYRPSSQSVRLSLLTGDDRPFVFSAPCLDDDRGLHLNTPFSSGALDDLFKTRSEARSIGEVKDLLGVSPGEAPILSSFFTEEPPRPSRRFDGEGVSVRYMGHACLLIESKDVTILCDPVISYEYEADLPRYTYADLPESIDYVLITHAHQDHCMLETLLQLRHKTKNIIVPMSNGGGLADPSLKLALQHIGFNSVTAIDELESIDIKDGVITGLPFPGEHGDLNIRSKLAYLISLRGNRILLVADSNNIEPKLYEHIHSLFGGVDALFIGMECDGAPMSWLYGPLLACPLARKMDQTRRFDGSDHDRAIAMVNQLKPTAVYVYAMGQEPWLTFLTSIRYSDESRPIVESTRLVNTCRERGLASERLYGSKQIHLNGQSSSGAGHGAEFLKWT